MATIIFGDFEWEDWKAERNLTRPNGVPFPDAAAALEADPNEVAEADRRGLGRVVSLAKHPLTGVLFIVTTEGENDRTRIISARKAHPHERSKYEKG